MTWLKSKAAKNSPFAWSCKRLIAELSNLDRQRLIKQIQGNATGERDWLRAMERLFRDTLKDSGWRHKQAGSGGLEALAQILRDDYNVCLFGDE